MSWKHQIISRLPPRIVSQYTFMRRNYYYRSSRAALVRQYGRYAEFCLPERSLLELFPEHSNQHIHIPIAQIVRHNVIELPLAELVALAGVIQMTQPLTLFEFGTYLGSSTLIIAQNSPSNARIFTLDLDPDIHADFLQDAGYHQHFSFKPGERFHGSPEESQITQLYVGSEAFDFRAYYGQMDFIFVDANHSYDYVKADTIQAFKLLKPGGVIVWDDYVWKDENAECVGVTRCLNELADSKKIYRIAQTRLGMYVDR